MAFSVINRAPGVYIDEVQLPGPIAGVATSVAAFVGPARNGPMNAPTFLTNWTQFVDTFGINDDAGPYLTGPPVQVTHAVRGFFENGGATCFFVRIGTAAAASLTLQDRAAPASNPTLEVMAQEEGVAGNAIAIEVQDASIVPNVAAARAEATLASASNDQATVTVAADAANFRPGDIVLLTEGATSERATIASTNDTTIVFRANLTNVYGGGTIRVADLEPGQTVIRLADSTGIESGSAIEIVQGGTSETGVVQAVEQTNHYVTLSQGLTNTYTMAMGDAAVDLQTLEFTLIVTAPGAGAENFPNLSMDPRHSRFFAAVIDSASVNIVLADPPSPAASPSNRPAVLAATNLANGQNDDVTQIGSVEYRAGIDELERIDEVTMLCVPDRTDQGIQQYLIQHCEKMQDRFAILDPQPNASISTVNTQRTNLSSTNGYGALYYPWAEVANPLADGRIKVPPSGHIAGLYARVDSERGVFKAPANETLRGVLALERKFSDDEQGPLNEVGINVIRSFPGRGILVWGARTIAPQDRTQWRYVNVRRLLLFIEESIQEGTQFAVFEPNNQALWEQVKRQVTDFLTRLWRDGALFGSTPDEAFRVRVDEELNTASTRALGQLIIEVILYPTTPAEFVIFRIIQEPGGPTVQE